MSFGSIGRFRLVSLVSIAAMLTGAASGQTVWFVDASHAPGGNGSSWASAFGDLQSALSASNPDDEIWVARGVYKPTLASDPSDPRSATFLIPNERVLYGGFAGTETSLDQRAGAFAATVLDGDIGVPGDPTDNCYHVVKMVGSAVFTFARLDGFTIQRGNGVVAGSSYSQGAGVFASAAGATHGPALLLRNCTIRDNLADSGGGLAATNLARISLDSCTVRGNTATLYGGGLHCITSYVTSYNTSWIHNTTPGDGGAVYTTSTSIDWVTFANDVFRDNSANRGGAIGIGGSQFVRGAAVVDSSTVAYNSAQVGGAIFAETTTAAKAQLKLENSIVWANTATSAPQIAGAGATLSVRRSDVQGGFIGIGNLNTNPLFVDGARRDFHLQPGSPACDAGDYTLSAADFFDFDHDGNPNEAVPHDHDHTRRFTDDPLAPDLGVTFGSLPMLDLGAFEL